MPLSSLALKIDEFNGWGEGPRFRMYNLDYKAAEVKVLAAYTYDPVLIQVINQGYDVHSFSASKVFGVPYENFEPPEGKRPKELSLLRDKIKEFVFGTMYGRGYRSIAYKYGIPEDEAKNLQGELYKIIPGLPAYTQLVDMELRHHGVVCTFTGRKMRFPLAMDTGCDRKLYGSFKRTAANFKIQSTSGEIVNGRIIDINNELKKICPPTIETINDKDFAVRAVDTKLTVHDSIAGQIDTAAISRQEFEDFMGYWAGRRVQEVHPWMPVPFEFDLGVGENYGKAS